MRTAIINPTTTAAFSPMLEAEARRYARPDNEIDVLQIEWGPASIEGHYEEELSVVAMLGVIARHAQDYDGFVIACYGDPGLYAARELSPVPVVGIAEASMHMASLVAHKFSIVTVLERIVPMIENAVRLHHMEGRCASIRGTTLSVLDCEHDPERAVRELIAEARKAIDEDKAEAILLGCGGFSRLDKTAQEALGVPVIDGVSAAVKMLEGIYDYGLSTSRVAAFKQPEAKDIQVSADALSVFAAAAVPA